MKEIKFTTVNGHTAMLLRTTTYKGHTIEKVERYGIEYYTVDHMGLYWLLRKAKAAIDNMN